MLKIMRSHKFFSVFFLGFVTIAITIVFVFWGMGTRQNPTEVIVAEVNKKRITYPEFERAYEMAYRRARENYRDEKEIEKLDLKNAVLDRLIENMVLTMVADKAGITVSDDEVRDSIMKEPAFQKDGVFDKEVYTKRLKLGRMTTGAFESQLKEDLLLEKVRRLIGETAELGTEETRILESIKDNKAQFEQAFLTAKKNMAVKAYVEGLKRQMEISINTKLLS